MIGKILNGRYEILEEIGKGGMAYVYKARCVLLNRIVAVKILRDDLDGGQEFIDRFNAEAHAAASLDHSNIVSIFDVGTDDNLHYITMEYVDGKTLKEYITSKGRLGYIEALDIAMQISDALTAAHKKNIVHRDIKPHNILITKDGRVKVTDFGIARFGSSRTLSNGNDILGSVHYISPEQAKGLSVDNRSDIYSLGVVIYEMLSGRVPFDADNPVSVAMMQIENSPIEITDLVGGVPLSAQHVTFKAMSKDPDLRYQTAEDLKIDISSVLKDPNVIIDKRFLYENLNSEPETVADAKVSEAPVTRTYVKIIMIALAAITSIVLVFGGYIFGSALVNNPKQFFTNLFSASSSNIAVPDLVGKSREEAKKLCDELGLTYLEEDEVQDDSRLPGTIVSQNPSANEKLGKDGIVNVVVTGSGSYFEMKDYSNGRNYEAVKSELESYGIRVSLVFEKSRVDEGDVIKHEPKKGELVKAGDSVVLYVSGTEPKDEEETDSEDKDSKKSNDEDSSDKKLSEDKKEQKSDKTNDDKSSEKNKSQDKTSKDNAIKDDSSKDKSSETKPSQEQAAKDDESKEESSKLGEKVNDAPISAPDAVTDVNTSTAEVNANE